MTNAAMAPIVGLQVTALRRDDGLHLTFIDGTTLSLLNDVSIDTADASLLGATVVAANESQRSVTIKFSTSCAIMMSLAGPEGQWPEQMVLRVPQRQIVVW